MCFLGVLHLAGVNPGFGRHVLRTVHLTDLAPSGRNCSLGQRRAVGPHIGDVPALIEPLRGAHRPLGRKPQLASGLLLERRRPERRVRLALVWLTFDAPHREIGVCEIGSQGQSCVLVQNDEAGPRRLAVGTEVLAGGNPDTFECRQRGHEGFSGGREGAFEVPVGRRMKLHAFALSLDHDSNRGALDPAR